MSDLLVALAGGVAGAVLVGAGRITTVPGEVRANDAEGARVNKDLESWADDEVRRWSIDRRKKAQDLNAAGLWASGAMANMMVVTNEAALIAARNAEGEARRRLEELRGREDWTHALWRLVRRRPFPKLDAADAVGPILDVWRGPVAWMDTETPVRDATRRTAADALQDALGAKLG